MTIELEGIDEHEEQAFALLPEQFKGAANLKSLLAAFVARVQEADEMLVDLWQQRWLDNATGAQLDGLGSIVGIEREGDIDDVYRVRIRARIYSNISRGTPDDVIRVAALLAGNSEAAIVFTEFYPAYFEVQIISGDITEDAAEAVAEGIEAAKPAGVGFALIYSTVDPELAFTLSANENIATSATQGLSDTAMSTGGYLAGVV